MQPYGPRERDGVAVRPVGRAVRSRDASPAPPMTPAPPTARPDPGRARGPAARRVLVTGVSGFIGTALACALHARGAVVVGVTRDAARLAGRARRLPVGVDLVACALDTPEACARLVEGTSPDCIVHLSSLVSGSRDLDLVTGTFAANLASTVFLMDAAARSPTARFVTAGSLEEPEAGAAPSSPYAASKAAAAVYARLYAASGALEIAHARIAMAYGPGQDDLSKLVPHVTSSPHAGRAPRIASGRRRADWVYIDDVVEALVRLVEMPDPPASVPVGTGRLHSVAEVVDTLVRLHGGTVRAAFGAREDRANEPAPRANASEAARALGGWRAAVDLETGLARTLAAFRRTAPVRSARRTAPAHAVPARVEPVSASLAVPGPPVATAARALR